MIQLLTKQKETHRRREQTYGCRGGEGWGKAGGGIVREFGMGTYTLLCLKWITNKDLPYSTGNSVWERMDACICMAESLCCAPETITTLLIGYTPIQN